MGTDTQALELKRLHANEKILNIVQVYDIQTEVTKSETQHLLLKSEIMETT